jgi:hypothetical protein
LNRPRATRVTSSANEPSWSTIAITVGPTRKTPPSFRTSSSSTYRFG